MLCDGDGNGSGSKLLCSVFCFCVKYTFHEKRGKGDHIYISSGSFLFIKSMLCPFFITTCGTVEGGCEVGVRPVAR